jgi:hypothetical protein
MDLMTDTVHSLKIRYISARVNSVTFKETVNFNGK